MDHLPGQTVAHYRIDSLVGHGGMAWVYLAQDLRHGRPVAFKVMRPDLAASLGDRFLREIRTTARLSHPLIVPLLDSGSVNDLLYYTMPYFPEGSLRDRLVQAGALTSEETLRIGEGVAEALDYAHRSGFVHRDIKPGNILLTNNRGCISDFGIATAILDSSTTLTQSGVVVGTPAYMSPEHRLGRPLDGKSDVYSLACVVIEMFSGHTPFEGNAPRILALNAAGAVPDVRREYPQIPQVLAGELERALAKDPTQRPSSAEFLDALRGRRVARMRWQSSKRRALFIPAIIATLGMASWGAVSLLKGNPLDGPMRLLSVEPVAGTPLPEAELENGTAVRLLVESGVPALPGNRKSRLDLIATVTPEPRTTSSHEEQRSVISTRTESRVTAQQVLAGSITMNHVDIDHRVHLSLVRTIYDDRTYKSLESRALTSFEYEVRPSYFAEGKVRLISADPPAGSQLSNAALRRGVRVRALVESEFSGLRQGFVSKLGLGAVLTDSTGADQYEAISSRKESWGATQIVLEGVITRKHVAGDRRVHLLIVRATSEEATGKEIGSVVLVSFEYDVPQ